LTPAPATAKPTPAAPVPAPPAAAPVAATIPAATPALAPDAVPPAPNSSKVAAGNYAVNVGSFSNIANANALVLRLKAAGLPVTSEKVKLNGGDAVRIRIGPYADRTAAEAARLRAESMAGGSGKVIALDGDAPLPAVVKPAAVSKPVAVTPTPAPAAPAVVPASKPVATVTSGFAVQLAAPAEESAANTLRDRARAAGFAAFVQRVDTVDGPRFRVRAGPVADHNAAEALRDSVNQKLGINGNIVAHP
jgi:cell division septation protein DedD